MKRIISIICAVSILFSGFSVLAATPIAFSTIVENGNLDLPIDENIIMKNGSVVIEFEDMEYDPIMVVTDDDTASGGKALKVGTSTQLQDPTLVKNASMRAKFVAEKEATYYVWVRARKLWAGTYTTLYVDPDNSGNYSVSTIQMGGDHNNYVWFKIQSRLYSPGVNYFNFKYRAGNTLFDKLIITSDSSYTPEGADASPLKAEVQEEVSANLDAIPVYPKKGEHPRLFFKAEDIPSIKEQLEKDNALKKVYQNILAKAEQQVVGKLPEGKTDYTFYSGYPSIFEAKAFAYAMGVKDDAFAKDTIKQCRDFIETVTFDLSDSTFGTRYMGFTMMAAACVYDWCYSLLTEEDKEVFVRRLPEIASETEMGYPPTKRNYLISHSVENLVYRDQLVPAVALYDELPYWFNIVGTIIFQEILPFQKFQLQSGTHTSGSAYTGGRTEGAVFADKIFNVLGYNESILGDSFSQLYYTWIYNRLPSGLWFKDGDDWYWDRYVPDTRGTYQGMLFRFTGSLYQDPILMYQGMIDLEQASYSMDYLEFFLLLGTELNTSNMQTPTDLPLTRFTTYPLTTMVARTSWQNGLNAPTAMAFVNMREMNIGDHQQADLGAFQLYYKGMLALDSGLYTWSGDSYYNYQSRSIAHNVLLVDDPNEGPYRDKYAPDGGQKSFYSYGGHSDNFDTVKNDLASGKAIAATIKGTYAGPTKLKPKFSYISGDIAATYSEKVEEYERSAVFINLDNEDYPAAFIVYDNIKSANADFKKRWLLHSELEPEVNLETNTTTIVRTENGQNGKLVNKTLIPSAGKTEIEKIGGEGKEWYVNGKNYDVSLPASVQGDLGAWRVEISPSHPSQEDRFLNAMYVCDADKDIPELPMYREYGSVYSGVTVMDNMVTFSNTRDNLTDSFSITVRENGYENVNCLLTDIEAGVWKISGNGVEKFAESKSGEYCLAFGVAPGRYTIAPASSNSKLSDEYSNVFEEPEDFGDFVIRKGNNQMYLPKPTKLFDGVAYVALDGIFTQLGAEIVNADEKSVTLKTDEDTLTLTADALTAVLNGEEIALTYPPKTVGGELYAPLDDFTKFLSISNVAYDGYAKVLSFKVISKAPIEGVDMSKVIVPVGVTGSEHNGTNVLENIYDRNLKTYYCSVEEITEVVYDLGEVYDISKVMMAFYNGHLRKTFFSISVSDDGENWRTAYDGNSNGKTEELQTFRVNDSGRYVKLQVTGNDNGSGYRSIFELLVMKK